MTDLSTRQSRKTVAQLRESAPPPASKPVRAGKSTSEPRVRSIEPKQPYVRRETGLAILSARGRISAGQLAAGERYHRAFDTVQLAACSPIRSNLAEPERAGGGTGGLPFSAEMLTAHEVLVAKAELHAARVQIRHSGLVASLDVICGKQWTPGMVSPLQREQDEIVTSLRIALDLLIEVYVGLDKSN